MNEILLGLIYFGIVFIIIFSFYFIYTRIRIKKHKDLNSINIGEINYLVRRFKLNRKYLNYKKMAFIVSLANAFIIAITCVSIAYIPVKFIWQMLIGFVILFLMIYVVYEIIGKILVKKGWNKNV